MSGKLGEWDVCGEELLAWCIEHSSVNKDGKKNQVSWTEIVEQQGCGVFNKCRSVYSLSCRY